MNPGALTPELRSAAPALAARLGTAILLPLAALIARAFLRNPARVGIIVLLWTRLNRAARRFDRLMARVAAGRQSRPGGTRATRGTAAPARPTARLPSQHAWLLKDLRHEAAVYANRLDRLLSEPATAAIIADTPQALRLLRPLCHMLGVRHASLGVRHASLGVRPASVPPPRREPRPTPAVSTWRDSPLQPGLPAAARPWSLASGLPPPPLHETIPCEHVTWWPWFPREPTPAT